MKKIEIQSLDLISLHNKNLTMTMRMITLVIVSLLCGLSLSCQEQTEGEVCDGDCSSCPWLGDLRIIDIPLDIHPYHTALRMVHVTSVDNPKGIDSTFFTHVSSSIEAGILRAFSVSDCAGTSKCIKTESLSVACNADVPSEHLEFADGSRIRKFSYLCGVAQKYPFHYNQDVGYTLGEFLEGISLSLTCAEANLWSSPLTMIIHNREFLQQPGQIVVKANDVRNVGVFNEGQWSFQNWKMFKCNNADEIIQVFIKLERMGIVEQIVYRANEEARIVSAAEIGEGGTEIDDDWKNIIGMTIAYVGSVAAIALLVILLSCCIICCIIKQRHVDVDVEVEMKTVVCPTEISEGGRKFTHIDQFRDYRVAEIVKKV